MSKPDRAQLMLGLAALVLGALVYVLDRPAQSFLSQGLSLAALTPNVFGVVGHSLPTLVHVFAFCLLTAALLAGAKRTAVSVCIGWFAIDALFEVGQHPPLAQWLSTIIPRGFEHVPILDRTAGYLLHGTFDRFDLLAAALGALAAYAVIQSTARWRITHE